MKRQFILDEYDFSDGELRVIFTFDEENYYEDIISEDIFEEFIDYTERLYYFEDKWDGYSESHYTEDKWMDYSEWLEDHCENSDIIDFLEII